MADTTSRTLTLENREEAVTLFGPRDSFLRTLRDALGVKVVARGDLLQLEGPEAAVDQADRAFQQLRTVYRKSGRLTQADVQGVIEIVKGADGKGGGAAALTQTEYGKYLRPRTDGQSRYVQAMKQNEVVIAVGPAGTGKTYLAVGWAVTLLKSGQVKKIVLVRPAVEAGERLGFLPGDLKEKINPYLRPLFDSLADLMDPETVERYVKSEVIEILPLAFMRGRTLNNACIILDEGQNATVAQMKMFLTRMGFGSRMIVTGDMTQVDLPRSVRNGLADATHRLKNIEGIAVLHLDDADIVRHPIVQKIVNAYDVDEKR